MFLIFKSKALHALLFVFLLLHFFLYAISKRSFSWQQYYYHNRKWKTYNDSKVNELGQIKFCLQNKNIFFFLFPKLNVKCSLFTNLFLVFLVENEINRMKDYNNINECLQCVWIVMKQAFNCTTIHCHVLDARISTCIRNANTLWNRGTCFYYHEGGTGKSLWENYNTSQKPINWVLLIRSLCLILRMLWCNKFFYTWRFHFVQKQIWHFYLTKKWFVYIWSWNWTTVHVHCCECTSKRVTNLYINRREKCCLGDEYTNKNTNIEPLALTNGNDGAQDFGCCLRCAVRMTRTCRHARIYYHAIVIKRRSRDVAKFGIEINYAHVYTNTQIRNVGRVNMSVENKTYIVPDLTQHGPTAVI